MLSVVGDDDGSNSGCEVVDGRKRNAAAPAPRFDVGAACDEQLTDVNVALGGGADERRVLAEE